MPQNRFVVSGVKITGSLTPEFAEIVTPEAMEFVASLAREFDSRRLELLRRRQARQQQLDQGTFPDFLPETRAIREANWTVISLGWRSPATSCGLPAAQMVRAGPRRLFGLAPTGGCRATRCCQPCGGLLPHRFTLTRLAAGGLFSVALSVALRRPGVTWQSARWSSDFPQPASPRAATVVLRLVPGPE